MLCSLLFGHMSLSAWGAEHMCSDAGAECSYAGAVIGSWLGICLHGILIVLMSKLLIGQASLWWASFFVLLLLFFKWMSWQPLC